MYQVFWQMMHFRAEKDISYTLLEKYVYKQKQEKTAGPTIEISSSCDEQMIVSKA